MPERTELALKNPEWLTSCGPLNKLGSEVVLAKHGFDVPSILTLEQAQDLLSCNSTATVVARGYCLQAQADAAGVDVWPSQIMDRNIHSTLANFLTDYQVSLAAAATDPQVVHYYSQMGFDVAKLCPRYFLQQYVYGQLITALDCGGNTYVQGRDEKVAIGLRVDSFGRQEWKRYQESYLKMRETHLQVSQIIKRELGLPIDCLTEMLDDGRKIWVVQARPLPLGAKIVSSQKGWDNFPVIQLWMHQLCGPKSDCLLRARQKKGISDKPYILNIDGRGVVFGSRPSLRVDYGNCQGLILDDSFWQFNFLNHDVFRLINLLWWKGKPVVIRKKS